MKIMTFSEQDHRKKLIFRSRRGLIELDMMLTHYCNSTLHKLDAKYLVAYEYLLDLQDQDLLALVLNDQSTDIDVNVFIPDRFQSDCEFLIKQIQKSYREK